jgi:ABC exporter DevB family membrane fusion protein
MDGKLSRVLVDEGDTVRRGQVLAVLDNADYAARIELARAECKEREAELERQQNGARSEEQAEAEANLLEAQAQLSSAVAERDRRAPLVARGAVSRSEYDLAARDAETAKQRVQAASERRSVARQQTRPEDLKRAEAEVARSQASLAEAQAMYEKTFIRSPIDGTVLRRYHRAGESLSGKGDTPVFALGDLSRLRVRVDIDETDVARIREGQPAYVTASAYGDRRFSGRIVRVGEALGRKNVRTDEPTERVDQKILETLVELDPGQKLPVGLRVDAFIPIAKTEAVAAMR